MLFSSFPPKSSNEGNAKVRRVESKEKEAKPRGRETTWPGHRVCACLPQGSHSDFASSSSSFGPPGAQPGIRQPTEPAPWVPPSPEE